MSKIFKRINTDGLTVFKPKQPSIKEITHHTIEKHKGNEFHIIQSVANFNHFSSNAEEYLILIGTIEAKGKPHTSTELFYLNDKLYVHGVNKNTTNWVKKNGFIAIYEINFEDSLLEYIFNSINFESLTSNMAVLQKHLQ